MKKIIMIGAIWALINSISLIAFGLTGLAISTYSCAAILWFGRHKLIKLLNI
jgi:hypothetical protein